MVPTAMKVLEICKALVVMDSSQPDLDLGHWFYIGSVRGTREEQAVTLFYNPLFTGVSHSLLDALV